MLFLLSSWGEKGHQKINSTAPQFFPTALNKYHGWSEGLAMALMAEWLMVRTWIIQST